MIPRARLPLGLSWPCRLLMLALALCLFLVSAPARPVGPPAKAPPPGQPDEPSTYQPQPRILQGSDGEVWSVALSADGRTLVSGTGGPRARTLARGGAVGASGPAGEGGGPRRCDGAVRWVPFAPGARSLGGGGPAGGARRRGPATGQPPPTNGDSRVLASVKIS